MTKNEINKVLNEALVLHNSGDTKKAINLLKLSLDDDFNERSVISLIGIILVDDNKFSEAIPYLEESIKLESQSEMVYLSMYIAYVKLNKFEKAIEVLGDFLEQKPAKLFKDTLRELLTDLSNGYALSFKDKIIYFANKNNIPIPQAVRSQK